ncbi:MAG: sensor histidine kinase [Spirochaetia bacterium]
MVAQKNRDPLSPLVLPIVLLLQFSILGLFQISSAAAEQAVVLQAFEWHFHILMSLSAALSLLLFLIPDHALLLLVFRLSLYFLIAYPLGLSSSIVIIIMITTIFEICFYLPVKQALWYIAAVFLISTALADSGSAFYFPRAASSLSDILFFMLLAFFSSLLLLTYKSVIYRLHKAENDIDHLKSVISQLSNANLDFQRYAHSVEYSTVNSERHRISSEIHDTVGYSLTNILMTIEAANALIDKDRSRAHSALTRAISEAQNCLEETRHSMHKIRANELKEAAGLQAIAHLARSFSEATGMEVRVEYGNAPESFGSELDLVLFRIIQEGLTNSFRHGMASLVRISLWMNAGQLKATILDNGRSTSKIIEGLGISGMRERIENVGGTVEFNNQQEGFIIRVNLPLPKELYEQDKSSLS